MIRRHSYAVARLRNGANPCQIQKDLGHRSIKTTLRYERYILPTDFVSPADRISSQALGLKSGVIGPSGKPLDPQSPSAPPPSASHPPALAPEAFRTDALELPFPEISSPTREFYAMLKTCIKDRYLALRASAKYLNEAGRRILRRASSSA